MKPNKPFLYVASILLSIQNGYISAQTFPWPYLLQQSFCTQELDAPTKTNKFLCALYRQDQKINLQLATTLERMLKRNEHECTLSYTITAKEYALYCKESEKLTKLLAELELPDWYTHLCSGLYILARNSPFLKNTLPLCGPTPFNKHIPPVQKLLKDLEIPPCVSNKLILLLAKFEAGKKNSIKQKLNSKESLATIEELIEHGEKLQLPKACLGYLAQAYCSHAENHWITSAEEEIVLKRLQDLTRFFGHTDASQYSSGPSLLFRGAIPGVFAEHHTIQHSPFTPDGKFLLIQPEKNSELLHLVDVKTQTITSSIQTIPFSNHAPVYNCNGSYLASINLFTREISLFACATGEEITRITLSGTDQACQIAFAKEQADLLYVQENNTTTAYRITQTGAINQGVCPQTPKELLPYVLQNERYTLQDQVLYDNKHKRGIGTIPLPKQSVLQSIIQPSNPRIFLHKKTDTIAIQSTTDAEPYILLLQIKQHTKISPLEKFFQLLHAPRR